MRRDTLLAILTLSGPALWWWPTCIEPNLGMPWWLPLLFLALWTSLSTILSGGRWLRFSVASTVGTFLGLCLLAIWWPSDGIARSYLPHTIAVATLAAAMVSLVVGLVVQKVSVSNEKSRRALWLALICCFAFGPAAVALTPPLVARRVKRNDMSAAERFESLKNAVQQTMAESGDPGRICNGLVLKRHYSGPPFSEDDWNRITGNYVKRDGYSFMVYCREKGGYTIDATPFGGKADGTRRFCADESGRVGCGMDWNRSRYACIPCTQ